MCCFAVAASSSPKVFFHDKRCLLFVRVCFDDSLLVTVHAVVSDPPFTLVLLDVFCVIFISYYVAFFKGTPVLFFNMFCFSYFNYKPSNGWDLGSVFVVVAFSRWRPCLSCAEAQVHGDHRPFSFLQNG